ncbi:hypothetical protein NM688_g219 [Phlebia brevispora]|uniref:Uncharacterized protein n=1 Tax=Phlebia brevispora TaxID=194682 RepID=A0ACC1TEU7_9APHY|nr:hypothetical protein NM688_g219 [Phlebia brevispora]
MDSTAGLSAFPQELLDAIIDHLHDDNSTLRRCSLVSRALLESSQYHLFRSLRVTNHNYARNFTAFANFLENGASPRFCAQVRTLVIRGDQGSYDFPSRALLDRALLSLILKKLTHLSSLTISDVRLQDSHTPACRRFKLEKLIMSSVGSSRDSPRTILSFLDVFAEIGMLQANFVDSWYEPALSQGLMKPLGHTLDSLSLRTHNAHLRGWTTVNCMLDILRRSTSVHTLHTLNVECSDTREVTSVGELLGAVGSNMFHVSIDLSIVFRYEQGSLPDPGEIARALDLSSATNLQSLRICIFPNLALPPAVSIVYMARASECLALILASLSPTVTNIVLELCPTDVMHERFALIDWEALSAVDWDRFADFKRFNVVLTRAVTTDVATEIRRKLYALDEKGILGVAGDEDYYTIVRLNETVGLWVVKQEVIGEGRAHVHRFGVEGVTDIVSFAASRSYDYVIAGGGTTGLTLAARLSEDPGVSVLVLESGLSHLNDPNIKKPSRELVFGSANHNYVWDHRTVSYIRTWLVAVHNQQVPQVEQEHAKDREFVWVRGKGLGGSSNVNFSVWTKPSREDIDDIEKLSNLGWNWNNYQSYLARTEGQVSWGDVISMHIIHIYWKVGRNGPMLIAYPTTLDRRDIELAQVLFNAGIPVASAPFDGDPHGVFFSPSTFNYDTETRYSAVKAFYRPIEARENLLVVPSAHVSRIITSTDHDKIKADGVEVLSGGKSHTIYATKEVIVCAGAIYSPQILELSGIGSKETLLSAGVPVKVDLPGMGENVQEHIAIRVNWSTYSLSIPPLYDVHQGVLTAGIKDSLKDHNIDFWCTPFLFASLEDISGNVESIYQKAKQLASKYANATDPILQGRREQYKLLAERFRPGSRRPTFEFIYIPPFGALSDSREGDRRISFSVVLNHLFSRGNIHVTSSDPLQSSRIDPHYFEEEIDLDMYVEAVKFARKLGEMSPIKEVIDYEIQPGPEVQTDEQLRGAYYVWHYGAHHGVMGAPGSELLNHFLIIDWIKSMCRTTWHTVGTCSMLPRDKGGVVDHNLKVYGTSNIRVADLSVVPLHFVGHSQSTVYAIAEQAAARIKGEL